MFKCRWPDLVLDLRKYTADDYRRDLQKLESVGPTYASFIKNKLTHAEETAYKKSPAGYIWNVTRLLAGEDARRWSKILSKTLEYVGVRDDGLGIIHENEPRQGVFFANEDVEHVVTLDNNVRTYSPRATSRARKGLEAAVERLWALKYDFDQNIDTEEKEQALRKKLIDPFMKHSSEYIRSRAVTRASDAAQLEALQDESENVRLAALGTVHDDEKAFMIAAEDSSRRVKIALIEKVIELVSNNQKYAAMAERVLGKLKEHGDSREEVKYAMSWGFKRLEEYT